MLRGKGAGRKNNTALGVRRGSFCINDINMLLLLRLLMVSLSFPSGFRHKNSLCYFRSISFYLAQMTVDEHNVFTCNTKRS